MYWKRFETKLELFGYNDPKIVFRKPGKKSLSQKIQSVQRQRESFAANDKWFEAKQVKGIMKNEENVLRINLHFSRKCLKLGRNWVF